MFRTRWLPVVLTLILSWFATSVRAEIIRFNFTGHVDFFDGTGLSGTQLNDPVSGYYEFESTVAGEPGPEYVVYQQPVTARWSITCPSGTISNRLDWIAVLDNHPPSIDRYSVGSFNNLDADLGTAESFAFILTNPLSTDVVSSGALPLVPYNLADWLDKKVYYTLIDSTGQNGIRATVDSFTLPEPVSFLLVVGLGVMLRVRRQK